ncbi:MAG: ComF family protein [Leptolyngbyaceae cyanobacterium MAG.088]|nr:ComF family protein [Leptolyngbyaceae cyanobacterium MAG.088]
MPLPRLLGQLTQFFLVTPCPLCQRPASPLLCDGCYRQMLACQWKGSTQNHLIRDGVSQTTLADRDVLSVFSWGKYTGVLKQLLALLKYGNQAELGIWLGCQLGQQWRVKKPQKARYRPVVVPIPLHRQRLKQRGYNQAALIAQGFCRATGLPLAEHGLVRIKATNAMHSLSKQDRQTNLMGAFQLGQSLPHKSRPILLIDDIYTTGTTAKTAILSLMQAGYSIMGVATVAQAVLSSPLDRRSAPYPDHQTLDLNPNL